MTKNPAGPKVSDNVEMAKVWMCTGVQLT